MTKIDLHNHTTKSDGHNTPYDVIDMAARHGVEVLAITDHDTVAAYTPELFEYAKARGILLIPGVEISSHDERRGGFHILGYNIDFTNEKLVSELQRLRDNRKDYLFEVAEKLLEFGFIVDVEKLSQVESVAKGNIAEDIIANPENRENLLNMFGTIPNKSVFITTLMNKGCPAYIKKASITPKEAADLIRQAGGKVVLAHPIVYVYDKGLPEEEVVSLIDEVKPDGLETHYIHFDKKGVRRDESEKWGKVAKARGLFETIGSDFHWDDGVKPLVGFANEEMEFGDDEIENLLNKIFEQPKGLTEETEKDK